MARFKGRAPNDVSETCRREELEELLKLLYRQLRVAQNPLKQSTADHLVVRDSDRSLSGTREVNVAPALAHLRVAEFRQRLHDRPARKNR